MTLKFDSRFFSSFALGLQLIKGYKLPGHDTEIAYKFLRTWVVERFAVKHVDKVAMNPGIRLIVSEIVPKTMGIVSVSFMDD